MHRHRNSRYSPNWTQPSLEAVAVVISLALCIAPAVATDQNCRVREWTEGEALQDAKTYLIGTGYSSIDVESLKLNQFFRRRDEPYPTFQFELLGVFSDHPRRFVGVGNECGILEINDYGTPSAIPLWTKVK